MSKLIWDEVGERLYETGVKNGTLYKMASNGAYTMGVPWNGLISVSESPEGAEATALYADDIKYLNLMSNEEFKATIEAYTYPDEFAECDGSASIADGVFIGQQTRTKFGLAYKTTLGNDVDGNNYGYKLHLIYGALASPSEKSYSTINDSPEAITFSWEVSTTPVSVEVEGGNFKPTACVTIDSTKTDSAKLAALEEILFGKDNTLLKTEPSDWNTNFKNYFTKNSEGKFVAISESSAPSFEEGKFYDAGIEARLPLPGEVASIMGLAS